MRIGLVIYGNIDTGSGGYLYDRMVLAGLRRLGHEVEIISLPAGTYLQRLFHGFFRPSSRGMGWERFDIIIEDELCHPTLFLTNRKLLQQKGRPFLISLVHHILSDEPRNRFHNRLLAIPERCFLDSVDGYIYNSKTTRSKVRTLTGHDRPELIAYPGGDRFGSPVSAQFIRERGLRPGPLELLFLGNVVPRKGLLPLLRGLCKVDRRLWRLSVAGSLEFDPAHGAEVRALIGELELAGSVRLYGPLEDTELTEALKNSHLFCMPYAYEGFGIAILEAMAFGLPAFGCLDGAAGETICHGENGFLLAADDIRGLAPLLVHLHQDRTALLRLSEGAFRTYAKRPGWQESIYAIDTFLHEVISLHGHKEMPGSPEPL